MSKLLMIIKRSLKERSRRRPQVFLTQEQSVALADFLKSCDQEPQALPVLLSTRTDSNPDLEQSP